LVLSPRKLAGHFALREPIDTRHTQVQHQLAAHAAHLSCGHTIHCKQIKAMTIE
jgi:hypothetical protein